MSGVGNPQFDGERIGDTPVGNINPISAEEVISNNEANIRKALEANRKREEEWNPPQETRDIAGINALAKQLGWSDTKQGQLNTALNKLSPDGVENPSKAQFGNAWEETVFSGLDEKAYAKFAQEAAQGEGPEIRGTGKAQSYNDCALYALANATGKSYDEVAERADQLISQGNWRRADERADPQKVFKSEGGLNGGEVILVAESFGQAEVVPSTDFAKILKEGRPVMVNIVSPGAMVKDGKSGHEVVLTRTFQHDGETWYSLMDSSGRPDKPMFLSDKALNIMLQEKGVAYRPEQ